MPFGGFGNEDLFEVNMALRCEVKNLRRTVDEFKSVCPSRFRGQ